ncbi:MAG: M23 family metallopeptidase [Treponema sp.]|jgi:murein DD-endopeptidase MepM/ murein hydrolase activator NlpD|nr:M23 family metallopeptidase [Treponema sp.]
MVDYTKIRRIIAKISRFWRSLLENHPFPVSGLLLRVLLICSMVYFVQAAAFSPAGGGKKPAGGRERSAGGEGGMGGFEEASSILPVNFEQQNSKGVPEPEEYSRPRMLLYSLYIMQSGDTIGRIAKDFGLNEGTLFSLNGISNDRIVPVGEELKIPNQDGIMYTVKQGDTLESIAKKYEKYAVDPRSILIANELFTGNILPRDTLFIPGAQLSPEEHLGITGNFFLWPIRGRITSPYGYRVSPFTGNRTFHSGMDIGSPLGTPIKAAMAGLVIAAGYDATFGNYVIISHHAGYRTMYGHMNAIRVKAGAYVGAGDLVGTVGSTGLSTGAHLHFAVYKNGRTMNPRLLLR